MPLQSKNALDGMSSPQADHQSNQSPAIGSYPSAHGKTRVIGLYGIPGSGKTFLLSQLKQKLGQEHFAFYEGSEVIATLVPGGLEAFQKLKEADKVHWRQSAINTIKKRCRDSGKAAVVTGHFMFWPEEEEKGQLVYTQNDLDTFTHVLYLEVPAEVVMQRRHDNTERDRPHTTVAHLRKWQQAEKTELRSMCYQHGILFSVEASHPTSLTKVLTLIQDFLHHTEEYNLSRAEESLDEALAIGQDRWETVLVMDADGTLAAEDTGALFWKRMPDSQHWKNAEYPLKTLFSSPLGYSYAAFRQATLLYEETTNDEEFDIICQDVASAVTMHPEFASMLQLVAKQEYVGAVVVSCGLHRVWEKVLKREGLSERVKVIGGGRIADGFVVTPAVKGNLVTRLRDVHQTYIWAFGDSPLDMEMLSKADQAIIVTGEEQTRSKSMDAALMHAIDAESLQARQVVLPSTASPRLDTKLPLTDLTENEFMNSVLSRRDRSTGLRALFASDKNAAKLLATSMRDAAVAGPSLREAHRRVGWYLAIEFMSNLIGVEECQISHVLGHHTSGYRLLHEKQTTIVALMRGGEPMALGINDAYPLAMFVHAKSPDDIKLHHVQGQLTIMLVDSVVNTGKTIMEFAQAIRGLHATIRIIVVAGVVQAQCILRSSLVGRALIGHDNLTLVALRRSDTKFTGSGTTDTGNRLFNTTHLL